jgi:hypothetical protein
MRVAALGLLLAGCASGAAARPECSIFVMADCPIANAFAPEINRIVADYPQVEFRVVYVTGEREEAERHAKAYGFAAPVEVGRERAMRLGVTVTPEAVVTVGGERVYRGRIDDRYIELGRWRFRPTTRDLRDALDDVLAGRAVRVAETTAVGCTIGE